MLAVVVVTPLYVNMILTLGKIAGILIYPGYQGYTYPSNSRRLIYQRVFLACERTAAKPRQRGAKCHARFDYLDVRLLEPG